MVQIVKPNVEIYNLNAISNVTKHIERCGRTCYKSEDKITEGSADKFINGILRSGHESVIEHANLCFELRLRDELHTDFLDSDSYFSQLSSIRGLNVSIISKNNIIVSGNMRSFRDYTRLVGGNIFNDYFYSNEKLKIFADNECANLMDMYDNYTFYSDKDDYVEKILLLWCQNSNEEEYSKIKNDSKTRFGLLDLNEFDKHNYITIKMTTDVGSYKDLTRHRPCSFSIESTRYCNYSKDKFGNELFMMKPSNMKENTSEYEIWINCMKNIESSYLVMATIDGIRADQLRMLLPHSTKADAIMTANVKEWKHIFALRCAPQAHPSVRHVMLKTLKLFYETYPYFFENEYNKFKNDIDEFEKL